MSASTKLIQASAGVGGGDFYPYTVDNSARFNDNDSAYLYRTPSSATNRIKWTYSVWVKRANLSSGAHVFLSAYSPPYQFTYCSLENNSITFGSYNLISPGWIDLVQSTDVMRDSSAWYHFVWVYDSANATASNRVKLYVNNKLITSFLSANYPTSSYAGWINNTVQHSVGSLNFNNSRQGYVDGYMSQVAFVDGQALDPSSFGEEKNGIWVPKDPSGLTFGTNGFYLDFADSANLGNDVSGNNNDFTVSGLTADDQMIDTPINNFCTWNPITGVKFDNLSNPTADLTVYSNGNLNITTPVSAGDSDALASISTMAIPDGVPIYAEFTNMNSNTAISVGGGFTYDNPGAGGGGETFYGRVYYLASGTVAVGYGATGTVTGSPASFLTSDIIGVRVDKDAQTVKFYKNDVLQATVSSCVVPDENWYFQKTQGTSGATTSCNANWGQLPFTYSLPADHLALCTANLPEPTIGPNSAIKPSDVFGTVLYTGNGTAIGSGGKTVDCGVDMTDGDYMVAIKNRDAADSWMVFDTVRGATKYIEFDSTDIEVTDTESLNAFTATGVTLGNNVAVNTTGEDYVLYWFKVTEGFFDIVSFDLTGTGNRNISHNLGVPPQFLMMKPLANGIQLESWFVYCESLPVSDPETDFLYLDKTDAVADNNTIWNDTAPTSSVFTIGSGFTAANYGTPQIAYLFADVEGFCKTGYYEGNGSADGAFEYLGFSPELHVYKRTDVANSWVNILQAINPTNDGTQEYLMFDNPIPQAQFNILDQLSNGIKLRTNSAGTNASGGDYITLSIGTSSKYSNAR